jgi:hypothetical protein
MTEMDKLIIMLNEAKIPYDIRTQTLTLTPQIIYPSLEIWTCDVICHEWSYGGKVGLLEMMGLIPDEVDDEVEGYLTADVVFRRILKDYLAN